MKLVNYYKDDNGPSRHMGQTFKNGPSKTCGRQPLKNFTWSILEDLDLYTENI